MENSSSDLQAALKTLGHYSLTDLFLAYPKSNLFTAAELLSREGQRYVPVEIERALREECTRRNDLHFFARVTLFTALTAFKPKGWGQQHYLLAGHWAGMLGEGMKEFVLSGWNYLKGLKLEAGWQPESIFDPILEEALKYGFAAKS